MVGRSSRGASLAGPSRAERQMGRVEGAAHDAEVIRPHTALGEQAARPSRRSRQHTAAPTRARTPTGAVAARTTTGMCVVWALRWLRLSGSGIAEDGGASREGAGSGEGELGRPSGR